MRAPVVRAAILTLAFVLGMGRVGHAQLVVHDPAVTLRNSITAAVKEAEVALQRLQHSQLRRMAQRLSMFTNLGKYGLPNAPLWRIHDWQDPAADPSGVPLTADNAVYEPATGLAPDAAPGPLALVSLSTSAPLTASRVESLGPAACDPSALAALPDADVAVTSLVAERP